jgi:hypothetical protein
VAQAPAKLAPQPYRRRMRDQRPCTHYGAYDQRLAAHSEEAGNLPASDEIRYPVNSSRGQGISAPEGLPATTNEQYAGLPLNYLFDAIFV